MVTKRETCYFVSGNIISILLSSHAMHIACLKHVPQGSENLSYLAKGTDNLMSVLMSTIHMYVKKYNKSINYSYKL